MEQVIDELVDFHCSVNNQLNYSRNQFENDILNVLVLVDRRARLDGLLHVVFSRILS